MYSAIFHTDHKLQNALLPWMTKQHGYSVAWLYRSFSLETEWMPQTHVFYLPVVSILGCQDNLYGIHKLVVTKLSHRQSASCNC